MVHTHTKSAPHPQMTEGRRRNHQIKAALKTDPIERTRRTGEALIGSLTPGNVKEVWRTLQGWYREAGETAPKPCYETMEAQTEEREKLYARAPPLGANERRSPRGQGAEKGSDKKPQRAVGRRFEDAGR